VIELDDDTDWLGVVLAWIGGAVLALLLALIVVLWRRPLLC
jgi:hypothetical protein